jgi:hypothetical protein
MREVLLLVGMIEQLDASGADGRAIVARGLASGDLYLHRWTTFLWEQLRVNRVEIKSNFDCYSDLGPAAADGELAAFIRDNDAAGSDFGQSFTLGDVLESSLRLDDLSPLYRADMFARMARPLQGANISQEEFEVNARSNFGEIFESAYLGRRTGCLECHNSEASVTYSPDPQFNQFWAIPGNFERALYGAPEGRDERELYAMFRWTNFVDDDNGITPWGMSDECGRFSEDHDGDILSDPGYLGGDLPDNQQLFDVDPLFKSGFASLGTDGLDPRRRQQRRPRPGARLPHRRQHRQQRVGGADGLPADAGPQLPAQRAAAADPRRPSPRRSSPRTSRCAPSSPRSRSTPTSTPTPPTSATPPRPYFMEPVFDPFTISSNDPSRTGNGVGDRVQRFSAWVLVESAMRAMWWDLPVQQIPNNQGNFPGLAFLRDEGIFVKDAQNGFNGVDFNGMLSWEDQLATGYTPGLQGECTGPLGQPCAEYEWIELMLTEAAGDRRHDHPRPRRRDQGPPHQRAHHRRRRARGHRRDHGPRPRRQDERRRHPRARGRRPPLRRPDHEHPPIHAVRRPQPRPGPRADPQASRSPAPTPSRSATTSPRRSSATSTNGPAAPTASPSRADPD